VNIVRSKVILVVLLMLIPKMIDCQSYLMKSQEEIATNPIYEKDSLRSIYIYSGIGIYEWFNLGIGYQFNNHFSVSLKHANTWVSGHGGGNLFPPTASGLECEIKYYKDIWIFNNISFSYLYFLSIPNVFDMSYGIKPKGGGFELNIGNERIEKGISGKLHFYWSVGIGINYNKAYSETLIMPSIKVGVSHNFF